MESHINFHEMNIDDRILKVCIVFHYLFIFDLKYVEIILVMVLIIIYLLTGDCQQWMD